MGSVRKWTSSCPEDFCLYSVLKVSGISKDMDQELPRGLLLIFLITSVWNNQEMDQELRRGFLLIFCIKNGWNQQGNGPAAPHMTSAHILYWRCVEPFRKWTRSCKGDLCFGWPSTWLVRRGGHPHFFYRAILQFSSSAAFTHSSYITQ